MELPDPQASVPSMRLCEGDSNHLLLFKCSKRKAFADDSLVTFDILWQDRPALLVGRIDGNQLQRELNLFWRIHFFRPVAGVGSIANHQAMEIRNCELSEAFNFYHKPLKSNCGR